MEFLIKCRLLVVINAFYINVGDYWGCCYNLGTLNQDELTFLYIFVKFEF